jgi:hypothetical protein
MLTLALALLFAVPVQLVLQPGSRLWIDGDSNLRTWSCEARALETSARAHTREGKVAPSIDAVQIAIAVKELRCGDDHMDEKLRDALHADRIPLIEYSLESVARLPGPPAAGIRLKMSGRLAIAGQSRPITMLVIARVEPAGLLRATGSVPLEMSAFGVEPPTAFLGLLRSKDRIVVRFDLAARAVPEAASPTTHRFIVAGR